MVLPVGTVFAEVAERGLPQSAVKIGGLRYQFPGRRLGCRYRLGHFRQRRDADMTRVPGGALNLLEWLIEGLYDFLERIIGAHLVKRTFGFLATIFIFFFGKLVWSQSRPLSQIRKLTPN